MRPRGEVIQAMREYVEAICDRIGPRPPCSEAERKAAEYIKAQWEASNPDTALEEFTCHPGAYRAMFRWPIALFILSLCTYHLLPLVSLVCTALSMLILVCEMMFNQELIDWIFPTRSSCNVISRFEPEGPVRNRVIVSCHHDSNFEFPLENRFGPRFSLLVTFVIVCNLVLFLVSLLGTGLPLAGSPALVAGYQRATFPLLVLLAASVPLHLTLFLHIISDRPVVGANDNLSGEAVCLSLAGFLAVPENRPKHTSVWLASFGCEEFGTRGSKRFIKRHLEEIRNAHVLNLDMVGEQGSRLWTVTKEEVNLIPLSGEMVALVLEAGKRSGVPLRAGPVMFFTDAMAFARNRIRATSLISLDDQGVSRTHHWRGDTPDKLDYDLMHDCYRVCVEFIRQIEARADRFLVLQAEQGDKQEYASPLK